MAADDNYSDQDLNPPGMPGSGDEDSDHDSGSGVGAESQDHLGNGDPALHFGIAGDSDGDGVVDNPDDRDTVTASFEHHPTDFGGTAPDDDQDQIVGEPHHDPGLPDFEHLAPDLAGAGFAFPEPESHHPDEAAASDFSDNTSFLPEVHEALLSALQVDPAVPLAPEEAQDRLLQANDQFLSLSDHFTSQMQDQYGFNQPEDLIKNLHQLPTEEQDRFYALNRLGEVLSEGEATPETLAHAQAEYQEYLHPTPVPEIDVLTRATEALASSPEEAHTLTYQDVTERMDNASQHLGSVYQSFVAEAQTRYGYNDEMDMMAGLGKMSSLDQERFELLGKTLQVLDSGPKILDSLSLAQDQFSKFLHLTEKAQPTNSVG